MCGVYEYLDVGINRLWQIRFSACYNGRVLKSTQWTVLNNPRRKAEERENQSNTTMKYMHEHLIQIFNFGYVLNIHLRWIHVQIYSFLASPCNNFGHFYLNRSSWTLTKRRELRVMKLWLKKKSLIIRNERRQFVITTLFINQHDSKLKPASSDRLEIRNSNSAIRINKALHSYTVMVIRYLHALGDDFGK